jgi:hypothetical protein
MIQKGWRIDDSNINREEGGETVYHFSLKRA